MGKLIYLGLFLASLDPTYQTASDQARRALLETPSVKEEFRVFGESAKENVIEYTGLSEEELIYFGYAYPLLAGKISSKPFRNNKAEVGGYTIRPEVEYGLWNKELNVSLFLTKEF